jgi:hypothetical protein
MTAATRCLDSRQRRLDPGRNRVAPHPGRLGPLRAIRQIMTIEVEPNVRADSAFERPCGARATG